MKTATHYVAAGSTGLAFDCYRRALRAWHEKREELIEAAGGKIGWWKLSEDSRKERCRELRKFRVRRNTSIDRVDCRECLFEIIEVAEERLDPRAIAEE